MPDTTTAIQVVPYSIAAYAIVGPRYRKDPAASYLANRVEEILNRTFNCDSAPIVELHGKEHAKLHFTFPAEVKPGVVAVLINDIITNHP